MRKLFTLIISMFLVSVVYGADISVQGTCPNDSGRICVDSDDNKFYKGNGSGIDEIAVGGSFQPLEATLTDIADGTIAEDLVNTANPWADNEVSDTLTASTCTGNSATATALAADPTTCTNQFVRDMAANGTLSCASVGIADLASVDFGGFTCNGTICTLDGITVVNPVGSVSDWTTDVTNIQAAIDAGGWIMLGKGIFYVDGSSPEIFSIVNPIRITGAGEFNAIFNIKSTVANTVDLFGIHPAGYTVGIVLEHFGIQTNGVSAKNIIHIDLTNTVGAGIAGLDINHIQFPGGGLNGSDIYLTNPTLINGLWDSKIVDNHFNNGTYWNRIGDSIQIERNTTSGSKRFIEATQVVNADGLNGASTVAIANNGGQSTRGIIKLSGLRWKIEKNNLECIGGGTSDLACVEINGSSLTNGLTNLTTITDNLLTVYGGVNAEAHGLYIANSDSAYIRGNILAGDTANGKKDLYIASTAANTKVSTNNTFMNNAITDDSSTTAWTDLLIPDCTTAGYHLNYTASTHTLGCTADAGGGGCTAGATQIAFGTSCGGTANLTYDAGILSMAGNGAKLYIVNANGSSQVQMTRYASTVGSQVLYFPEGSLSASHPGWYTGMYNSEYGWSLYTYNGSAFVRRFFVDVDGAITGGVYNGLTFTAAATGFTIAGGTTSKTLTVDETVSLSSKAPKASPTFTGGLTLTAASFDMTGVSGTNTQVYLKRQANTDSIDLIFIPAGALSASNVRYYIRRPNSSDDLSFATYDGTDFLERMKLTDAGAVYMYYLTNAAGAQHVCYDTGGLLSYQASATACASSALKYKNLIEPYQHGLDAIMQIQPQVFEYKKGTPSYDQLKHIGIIADNLPDYLQYKVNSEIENYEDRAIMATIINAIKELKAEIDILTIHPEDTYFAINKMANKHSTKEIARITGDCKLIVSFPKQFTKKMKVQADIVQGLCYGQIRRQRDKGKSIAGYMN